MKRRVYTVVLEVADHDADLLDPMHLGYALEQRFNGTAIHFMGVMVDQEKTDKANKLNSKSKPEDCGHNICARIGTEDCYPVTDDEVETLTACGVARGIIPPEKAKATREILRTLVSHGNLSAVLRNSSDAAYTYNPNDR